MQFRITDYAFDIHKVCLSCEKNKPTTPGDHQQAGNAAQQVTSRDHLFNQYQHCQSCNPEQVHHPQDKQQRHQ